jgi:trans-2,3-dihydro-3-hydroxyanthranilate isomerase
LTILDISWVDVFTDRPLAGNPLAVVPDADDLTTEEMQAIAGELGLSETIYVLEELSRVRIFSPTSELPLAGHPVVGTVAELGRLGRLEDGVHVFQTNVGEIPVELSAGVATMTQPDLKIHRELDPEGCAALLGLELADVIGQPVVAETAVAQAFAQLRDLDALAAARPDLPGIERIEGTIGLVAWFDEGREVFQRFFAPQIGVPEDPATGAAAGAVGAIRVHQGANAGRLTVRQGEYVGRPSTIHVEIGGQPGSPQGVRVGGTALPVLEAKLDVDALRGR